MSGSPGISSPSTRAFTLIEILVSMALLAFLLSTATYAFSQTKKITERVQARQTLHNTARVVYERLRREIDALHQGGAFYLRSSGVGGVEMVFLSAPYRLVPFGQPIDDYSVDQLWSRWHWGGPDQPLTAARSRDKRSFVLDQAWSPNGVSYQNQHFVILSQARREAGPDPATTLNDNAFGTGHAQDRGDYDDMVDQALPLILACADLAWQVVRHDGSVISAEAGTASNHAIDGMAINGDAGGNRPCLIRLRFTLRVARLDLEEVFSFSFLAPGILPR